MKKQLRPKSGPSVVFPFHFAVEAMLWMMEVASERLEMSML